MEVTHVSAFEVQRAEALDGPRHSALVRVTHWVHTIGFLVLAVSGAAILLAHPRLYWGETGAVGAPSLIDLPLPFVLDVPIRGPGRYLHYLAAWICVANGLLYVIAGFNTHHFLRHLVPTGAELSWKSARRHLRFTRPTADDSLTYNVVQRLTYLAVIFVLFPLVIWTGLAMSPAITSVVPGIVTAFGGQQSARTVHFFVAVLLILFLFVHIGMVVRAGFLERTRAMITGRPAKRERT